MTRFFSTLGRVLFARSSHEAGLHLHPGGLGRDYVCRDPECPRASRG